ncbi:MAG TPA: ubiquinol-cytochrome C chaperone family protein [Allosphingosinicella sp.]|jgi:cytochrome b pre-mRNA-processing protein 3
MSFLQSIFGERKQRSALEPLYRRVVEAARDPAWYRAGAVPDTMDGRFDMVSSVLALVLLRLEHQDERTGAVLLTELFIDDMDGTMRQIGIGDHVVGKKVGRMMSALGGRLAAYREAKDEEAFEAAVRRNIFRDEPPSRSALAFVAARLAEFRTALQAMAADDLLAGRLPRI